MPSDINLSVSLDPVLDPASLKSLQSLIKQQVASAVKEGIGDGLNSGSSSGSSAGKKSGGGTKKGASNKSGADNGIDYTEAVKQIKLFYKEAGNRSKYSTDSNQFVSQTNKMNKAIGRAASSLKVAEDHMKAFGNAIESGNIDEINKIVSGEMPDNVRKALKEAYEDHNNYVDSVKAKNRDKEAATAQREAEKVANAQQREAEKKKKAFDKIDDEIANLRYDFAADALNKASAANTAGLAVAARDIYNNVIELDKSIVDLQIATGKSYDEVARMMKGYSQLGQELGASTSDVAKAADSWLRQGYDVAEANELVSASMVLSKLGQIDSADATTYLTSAMKGYGYEAANVMQIVDKLTAVDLVSATSAGDLAEAMQKTSVTANQVGVSLDMLIGMIATVSEVSQQSASVVGTAMKSMLSRMTAIKAGMLVDPETGENLSNVEAALGGVGIAIRDTSDNFREMEDVLSDVAEKWDTLSNVDQAAVANALGGIRQQESVRILMGYWDQVVNLAQVAESSTGSALEKFDAYTSGIEGRMASLEAAWQNFSQTFLGTDFIKSGMTGLAGTLDTLTNITEVIGGGASGGLIGGLGLLSAAFLKVSAASINAQAAQAAATGASISMKSAFSGAAGAVVGLIKPLAIIVGLLAAFGAVKYFTDFDARLLDSVDDYNSATQDVKDNLEQIESLEKEISDTQEELRVANAAEVKDLQTKLTYLERQLELEKAISAELASRAQEEDDKAKRRASRLYNSVMRRSVVDTSSIDEHGFHEWIQIPSIVDGLYKFMSGDDSVSAEDATWYRQVLSGSADWVDELNTLWNNSEYLPDEQAEQVATLLDRIDFITTGVYGNRVSGDTPVVNTPAINTPGSTTQHGGFGFSDFESGGFYSDAVEFSDDSLDRLLEKYPQLTEAVQAYKDELMSASELQDALMEADVEAAVANTEESLANAFDQLDGSVEGSEEWYESIEDIEDALGGLDLDDITGGLETVRDALEGDTEAFEALRDAAIEKIVVAAEGKIDDAQLRAGLYSVQELCAATGMKAEEVGRLLIGMGFFEPVTIRKPHTVWVQSHPLRMPTKHVVYDEYQILKPTQDNPFSTGTKGGGGGGKGRGGNTGSSGKKSIISETFTKNQDMFKTQLDNLKSLNNLYEEGSDKWLKNQQSIIETYQAYAAIVEEEYNRLIKAGHKVSDEEVQKIAKEMIKVNEDLYKSAEEYWEAVRENRIDELQHMADQIDSVISLKEAHHELVEEIKAETRALEDEYEMARDLAANPGLTDLEREALFSTEDYEKLTGELQKIAKEANEMYVDYLKQIESVGEDATDQLEFITNEFERQYELKLKEYEVAKANLAVTKAQKELENVRNQRTVAMLVGGVWTWVADSDAVQDAMENLADAEQELADAESDRDFDAEIGQLEQLRDSYESEIAALEALTFSIDELADHVIDLTKAFNDSVLGELSSSAKDYVGKFSGNGLNIFGSELEEIANGGYDSITFENENVQKLWDSIGSVYGYTGSKPELSKLVKDGAFDSSILSASGATYVDNRVYIDGIQLNDEQSDAFIRAIELLSYTYKP